MWQSFYISMYTWRVQFLMHFLYVLNLVNPVYQNKKLSALKSSSQGKKIGWPLIFIFISYSPAESRHLNCQMHPEKAHIMSDCIRALGTAHYLCPDLTVNQWGKYRLRGAQEEMVIHSLHTAWNRGGLDHKDQVRPVTFRRRQKVKTEPDKKAVYGFGNSFSDWGVGGK